MKTENLYNQFMQQLVANIKDEFLAEIRDVVRDVVQKEMEIMGRDAQLLNQRLTYIQISEEYYVSINSLKKWKKQGLLIPVCKGGRTLLFDRTNIEECLRNRPRIQPNFLKSA